MRSKSFPMPCLLLGASLALVSSCARPERATPTFPPSADLQAVTEHKPVPPAAIATSEAAADAYDIAIESWGNRLAAAGGRLCRWAARMGAALPFDCPAAAPGADAGD